MDEEFTLMLFTGMFLGVVMTLLIQAYGRRKVKKALGGAMPAVPQAEAEERRVALLASENERQQGQIGRLEERIQVLERIATDSPKRLADSIEALR